MGLKKIFSLKKAKKKENEESEENLINEVEQKSETKENIKPKPLKDSLINPKKGFFSRLKKLFVGRSIDEELYEELEELLIQSDIGFNMTVSIIEKLEKSVNQQKIKDTEQIYQMLKEILAEKLITENNELTLVEDQLNVILVVGVNGVGKTTSIGKIANQLKRTGKKVVVGAGDTFRAAAVEQLEAWGQKAGIDVVKQKNGSDPAAVVFDTIQMARNQAYDVAIIDTAGRLHNKTDLMKELEKINRIIKQQIEDTKIETLLVIDSTTGQNGLQQAKLFNDIVDLTGIVLTKFDGTAKGGIIFAISEELQKPIKFLGVGEGVEDLRPFNAIEFVDAIFED